MSHLAKKVMDKARETGAVRDDVGFFSVTDKKEVEVEGQIVKVSVPNGQHRVKILSEKFGKGKAFDGSEQDELQMEVEDNGKRKVWNVALKNKETGKVSYIVEALEEIEIGETFMAEAFKMKNGKYGTKISKVVGNAGIPTIQYDETSEGDNPPLSGGEDIPPSSIPF